MQKVAIVCGAGRGERFGGDKVFVSLWGRPIFYWSLRAFEVYPGVDEIVAITRKERVEELRRLSQSFGFKKVRRVVEGGARRQDSVLNGLEIVEDDAIVFIHDAARPALSQTLLKRLHEAYREEVDGVVPILRPVDTVKETYDGFVKRTLNRDQIALVQTPQVFLASTLKKAYANSGGEFTDDASAVETMGGRVVTVEGDRLNIKVTTREDLLILERIGRQICQS